MKKTRAADVCVLASGGIDSSACLNFYLNRGHKVLPLFVRYGQPACAAESRSIRAVCNHFGLRPRIVTVTGFEKVPSGEICGRNLFLISVALMATHGLTNIISMGIHGGTRYYDCGVDFAQRLQTIISSYTDGRVTFGAPFLNWSKQEIFKYCTESDVPVDITWSCEASNEKPCRRCLSCRDRERLLARA
jgi:7-cyano-7-deazaguanine synthase